MTQPLNLIFIIAVLLLNITSKVAAQVWSNVNSNVSIGTVLKVYNNKLYTCGNDTNSATSNNILVSIFDGTSWDTLPGKLYNGNIQAIEEFDGELYMAGNFNHIGQPVGNISIDGINKVAKWNGVQFTNPGAFLSTISAGYVYSMKEYNNELYIGGNFSNAGVGANIPALAKYDGITWSMVGGGLTGFGNSVYSMVEYNGDLIVAGRFETAGGISVNSIARWDGSQWFSMGDGLDLYVFYLYVDSITNTLYATGNIVGSGSVPISYIASWDGIQWNQVGNGLPSSGWYLLRYKSDLYAGLVAGSPYIYKLLKLVGQTWMPLASNVTNGGVYDLCEFQGGMFAAGNFTEIDSSCCYSGLAMFTDTTSVGIAFDEVSLSAEFIIYPNPAKEKISILYNDRHQGIAAVTIYDSKGIIVFTKQTELSNSPIEIMFPLKLSAGYYHCRVNAENFDWSQGFVVE